MPKTIIAIIIVIVLAGLGYWVYQSTIVPEEITTEGSKICVDSKDCVVFGETGDCNCGCYNKDDLPSSTSGECFCQAPDSCECLAGMCEGVFKENQQIEAKNGEKFFVTLEANPTTGYGWQVDFDPVYIELLVKNYVPSSPELIGSGGEEIFEFLAKESGGTAITFSYQRPWEEESIKEEIYEITID
jgi:inhibitor of cysteine peptidase